MNAKVVAAGLALVIFGVATGLSAQTPRLGRLMRQKLVHASEVLAAVVTSDWEALAESSAELEAISQDPGWAALPTSQYAQQSAAFLDAVRDLQAAARSRDLDLAPQAYLDLTMSCVRCHREVALARVAQ